MPRDPYIAVVDLETTGFTPDEHAPIEFGRCDVGIGGTPSVLGRPLAHLLYPGRSVPPESSAVHHLVDSDLMTMPHWRDRVPELCRPDPAPVAWAAHSAKFERQWLGEYTGPLPWVCTYKCALRAWADAPGHGNQTLRYWLANRGRLSFDSLNAPGPGGLIRGDLVRDWALPAHRAGPDAYVTAFLLRELLAEHSLDTLIAWTEEPAVLVRVPFGKAPPLGSRGMRWSDVDTGLLWWVTGTDMDADIQHTVRVELRRRELIAEPDDEFEDRDIDFQGEQDDAA